MSKYTTGELAKLCGVTVRTVQYYDTRGILSPSELSEGGRRLYTDDDLRQLRIICFLRDMGLPIDAIGQLLAEEEPGRVIQLLLEQQEQEVRRQLAQSQSRLKKLEELRRQVRQQEQFSVESIGDIAYLMERRTQLKRVHTVMLLAGLPMSLLEVTGVVLWIVNRCLVALRGLSAAVGSLWHSDQSVLFPAGGLPVSPVPHGVPPGAEGGVLRPPHAVGPEADVRLLRLSRLLCGDAGR